MFRTIRIFVYSLILICTLGVCDGIAADSASETEITSLREYLILNDQMFFAAFGLSPTTSFTNKVLVRNPSGSGKTVIVYLVRLTLDLASTTSQLNQITMRFRISPTLTDDGTAQTIRNALVGGTNTASLEVFSNPITSSPGTFVGDVSAINSSAQTSTVLGLEPGEVVNIQMKQNDANNGTQFAIVFAEIPK